MMMIIIILTASYIGDDVRIVYSLANTMRSFSVTDGRTDKGILGVGFLGAQWFRFTPQFPLLMSESDKKRYCLGGQPIGHRHRRRHRRYYHSFRKGLSQNQSLSKLTKITTNIETAMLSTTLCITYSLKLQKNLWEKGIKPSQ